MTKNRLKEYGLYSILGLDRKNIQLLSFIELLLFSVVSVGLGVVLGNRVPSLLVCRFIEAHSNSNRHRVFDATRERRFCTHFNGVYFRGCLLLKCDKDVHEPPVRNASEKKKGETKGRFILLRALIGAGLLGGRVLYVAND